MMPTPASEVPQTPLGRFYLALPDAISRVARAYADKVGFPAENFRIELMAAAYDWTYPAVAAFVEKNSMQGVNDFLRAELPLWVINDPLFDFRTGRRWIKRQMTAEEIEERCPPEPIVQAPVYQTGY